MRQRVIIIEDERDIVELVRYNFRKEGFEVESFSRGREGLEFLRRNSADLVLLDILLPDEDGFEICKRLRADERLKGLPVIFLTAKSEEMDRVLGLEIGADDYVVKPFSPRELVARVRSVLRGVRQPTVVPEVLRVGDLEIDASSMTVQVQGCPIPTTVREFRLLEYLATHLGRVLTRDQLLDAVWKETPFVTPRSIDVYVRRLREKIETDPRQPRYLKTLRGIGYRFEVPK